MMMRFNPYRFFVCMCCAVLLTTAGAASAFAQAPEAEGPPKFQNFFEPRFKQFVNMNLVNNRQERNSTKFLVTGICKGTKPLANAEVDNKAVFRDFFLKYYFPMMTHPDELGNIAQMRLDLNKQYFGGIKNDANGRVVRDFLNELTRPFMHGMAKGNFHPAVRVNAMLIIGDLDSRGPELFGDPRPAEPLLTALDVMQTELVSKDQIDAVRVAALIGIARHAELDRHRPAADRIPTAALRPVLENVLALVNTKEPPATRSPAGHMWMRRQGMEILASLAATRPIGPAADAINGIISDPNEPLALRCAAAEAQGKMRNPLADGVTAEDAAVKIIQLGQDILEAEVNSLAPYVNELAKAEELAGDGLAAPRIGGGIVEGGLGILEEGVVGGDDEVVIKSAPKIAAAQRRGRRYVQCIENGLFGVDGGPGIVAGIRDAAIKAKATKAQELMTRTNEILKDEAPLGEQPALAEVDVFFTGIKEQLASLEEIAPRPVAEDEPPADLGLGPATREPESTEPAPAPSQPELPPLP